MVKIPKRLRWWFHPKDGSNPTIIKTSVNGKPYVARGIERREFLSKSAKMAAVGGLGVALGSMGFPAEGAPSTNWNMGPGSQEVDVQYLIFLSGASWYRRDGDTGKMGDTSEGDSPTSDPVPLINRAISALSGFHGATVYGARRIVVNGDFTSSTTLNITTGPIVFDHYGAFTYTGTSSAVIINLMYTAFPGGFPLGNISQADNWIHLGPIIGPNVTSPWNQNATAYGVTLLNYLESTLVVDSINGFQDCVRIDLSAAGAIVAGCRFVFKTIVACVNGIHFVGDGNGAGGGGHTVDAQIFTCSGAGVLIDLASGASSEYNMWTGVCNTNTFTHDFVNNNNRADAGRSPQLVMFAEINFSHCTLGPLDVFISAGSSVQANQEIVRFIRLAIMQKQLAQAFTAATSLAVTFPYPEVDTNYGVHVDFNVNVGGYWITAKGTSGCTINWVTNTTGQLSYHLYR